MLCVSSIDRYHDFRVTTENTSGPTSMCTLRTDNGKSMRMQGRGYSSFALLKDFSSSAYSRLDGRVGFK